jgi:DNA-3-methyladenine glycosylase I
MQKTRCPWCGTDPLYTTYHDHEWGVPLHDDRRLFEMLVLEGAQAGLSWITILRKRENYRRTFAGFDPETVAAFDDQRTAALRGDAGIVRNRLKIAAAVKNARAILKIQERFGSLDTFLWRFVEGVPRQNAWQTLSQVPASTPEAQAMSRELKKMGCTFVGPTICYAFMQAVGMVNDHLSGCYRHPEIIKLSR